jgi:hypothetical protein
MTSVDELFAELERRRNRENSIFGKLEYAYWTIRRGLRTAWKSPIHIKWWYQRARYGFSDRDWWNGDWYLSGVIAGIMEKIVNEGHGVANSYADEDNPFDTDVNVMVERRDAEWNKYIAIFREYSKHGPAMNQEWKDDFGGVLDEDMQDALQWLSKHFQELWD